MEIDELTEPLTSWWDAELLMVEDQVVRGGDGVIGLVVFVLVYVLTYALKLGLTRWLTKHQDRRGDRERTWLDYLTAIVLGNTKQLFILVLAFYIAMAASGLAQGSVREWLWSAVVVAFYLQVGFWANAALADALERRRAERASRDPAAVTGYGLMRFFGRVGIWLMVAVSILSYFNYPIAGLIGALGVGGIAIAFAVQNILADVFNSMAIILDKPFKVGDFIVAGDTVGTVEQIGVKTTLIRSLSGERVVLSNTDLLNSRIHNYKHMRERRVVFEIGVVYETDADQLEAIPGMIREAIEAQPQTRFDRAHFKAYGDFALTFEVVYSVLSPDYGVYMDIQQAINLRLFRRFAEAGISFAYPTQELILRSREGAAG